ncbi:MAG: hypothetical protein AAGF95_23675 [Chloroflexota bacterium]
MECMYDVQGRPMCITAQKYWSVPTTADVVNEAQSTTRDEVFDYVLEHVDERCRVHFNELTLTNTYRIAVFLEWF